MSVSIEEAPASPTTPGRPSRGRRISVRREDTGFAYHRRRLPYPSELSGWRAKVAKLLDDHNFNLALGVVIGANVFVIVRETDAQSQCVGTDDFSECQNSLFGILNRLFLAIYTIEAIARFYAYRFPAFYSVLNGLDLIIVFAGYLDLVLEAITAGMPGPSLSILRLVRLIRLFRIMRVFRNIPELHGMMRGFLSSMKSMFWGFALICGFLLFFSVFTVELVYPLSFDIHQDDEFCKASFSTVWNCLLLFFQILVAGDEFGRCLMPIIKDQWWTFCLFGAGVICVQLGFMNLVLAVIVEQATRAKEQDDQELRRERQYVSQKATSKLSRICEDIDYDGSGTLSLDELLSGFDSNDEMKNIFGKLDMTRHDVEELFELMDIEKLGQLSYEYFIQNLRTCQLDDSRKSLTMLRLEVAQIARHCSKLTGELCTRSCGMSRQLTAQTSPDEVVGYSDGIMFHPPRRQTSSPSLDGLAGEIAEIRSNIRKLSESVAPDLLSAAAESHTRALAEIGAAFKDKVTSFKPVAPEVDIQPSSSGSLLKKHRDHDQPAATTQVPEHNIIGVKRLPEVERQPLFDGDSLKDRNLFDQTLRI